MFFLYKAHDCTVVLVAHSYLFNLSLVPEEGHQLINLVVVFWNVAHVQTVFALLPHRSLLW